MMIYTKGQGRKTGTVLKKGQYRYILNKMILLKIPKSASMVLFKIAVEPD